MTGHGLFGRAIIGHDLGLGLQRRAFSPVLAEPLDRVGRMGEPLVGILGHGTYYPRFGIGRASELGIAPDSPHFMVRTLAGYRPNLRERVVYPSAFGEI